MNEPSYMDSLTFEAATHTYRFAGALVPNITSVIPNDFSHIHPEVLEKARLRGSYVHRMTELYDKKLLDWNTVDEHLLGYLEAWIKARQDFEIEFDDYDVERRLYHPVDRYAGTGDRPRAFIKPPNQPRRLGVIELKCIAKMNENVGLQTAGQQRCENYRARALGIEETQDRWAFCLKPDGKYKAFHYTDKRHERVFLAYLVTVQWELAIGKRKLGK